MSKKFLWVLVLLTALFGAVNICSARDLMINPDEFYTRFCYIANGAYEGRFCSGSLQEHYGAYTFETVGGYTITLYSTSLKKDCEYAKIHFSLAGTNGTQLWTALLAFFLAADNNIFLDESQEEVLMDYIKNLSSNIGKTVTFDRIRIYGGTSGGKYYFTAEGK